MVGLLRTFHVVLAIAVILGYLFFVLVYLGPEDPFITEGSHEILWYATFLARTFEFHAGLIFAGVAGTALLARSFRLAAAAFPLCVMGLAPTLQDFSKGNAGTRGRAALRVMTANLLWVNRHPQPILDEILREDPDVLFLQEYTPLWHREIQNALVARYPHVVSHPAEEAFGAAIYSKQPLSEGFCFSGFSPGDRSPFLRARLRMEDRVIVVYCVHLVPPTWTNLSLFRQQYKELHAELKTQAFPIIAAGDFNFTRQAALHQLLLSLGLANAHDQVGSGLGTTFKSRFLPDIGIDHVLLSPGLTPTNCRTGHGRGSDHRPVIVDVRLEPTAK